MSGCRERKEFGREISIEVTRVHNNNVMQRDVHLVTVNTVPHATTHYTAQHHVARENNDPTIYISSRQ